MTQPILLEVALIVAKQLEILEVPYLIGGSVASTLHGEPRLTNDVDFAAVMKDRHVAAFVEALKGPFYIDDILIRDAIRRRGMFNVIHIASANKIDVHVMEPDAFQESELSRAVRARLVPDSETQVFVSSPEDTVLQKLLWNRKSGGASERQVRDVIGVLKAQRDKLDVRYLESWAERLDLRAMLERVLREAGIQPD
jgi:hypothetical protein